MKEREFLKGLKYVFSKDRFLKAMGIKNRDEDWINECDGKEVTNKGEYFGEIISGRRMGTGDMVNFGVVPEWCKCVGKEDNNGKNTE